MMNKLTFNLIIIGVFFILFATLASADLYLNSKVGTIYFNTTGISRASIGPGGNFSVNTSDFFVNIENSEPFIKLSSEFSKVQFLEDGERISHQKNLAVGFLDPKVLTTLREGLFDNNLGRVGIGTTISTQNILNFIGDMNG